ncbi:MULTISPECIES: hypothetical protein [Glycomyces]|uniref:Membrane protein YgcG n=2 Tax=Glycomyces TaxID=58113 RepID=A0A9X3PI76_9ACTN|nr:hypothetical protein [Glycomyces lechevalierae]MDA1384454.1 hypothetical protein [Glycomyces lechevalierae]MDR7338093.1 putative membrane protein YgcG [Glycomyces lechevalierae]
MTTGVLFFIVFLALAVILGIAARGGPKRRAGGYRGDASYQHSGTTWSIPDNASSGGSGSNDCGPSYSGDSGGGFSGGGDGGGSSC